MQHHSRCVPRAQASGEVALLKLFPLGVGLEQTSCWQVLGPDQEHRAKGKMGKEGRFPLLTPQLMLLQKHNWRKVWPT